MLESPKFDRTRLGIMTKRHRIKLLNTDRSKAELVLRKPIQVTVVASISLVVGLGLVALGILLT
jgi:hypothetical protein